MNEKKRLIDVWAGWMTGGGVFSVLEDLEGASIPWADEGLASFLDAEYYGNISGDKPVSPLLLKIMDGETLTDPEKEFVAATICTMFDRNWAKDWATLSAQYNPIENYSMTEEMTDDQTVSEYGKIHTREDNLTDETTQEYGKVHTREDNLTDSSKTSVYGFNSDAASDAGEGETTRSGVVTDRDSGDDSSTLTRSGTVTDRDSGEDTHTRNYTLTRSGNIGVTTSQQMLQSERELWIWNFFRDVVFPDLDKVLTLRIY